MAEDKIDVAKGYWRVRNYLPGLVLGCVADAWINERDHLGKIIGPGSYVQDFLKSMAGGDAAKRTLADILWQAARSRLAELVNLWGDTAFHGTFLDLFVNGPSDPSSQSSLMPNFAPAGLRAAVAALPAVVPTSPATSNSPLCLSDSLRVLIDDWLLYRDFLRQWPSFLQAARLYLDQCSLLGQKSVWTL